MYQCSKLKGHKEAVVCLSLSSKESVRLASGGEDGLLLLHDVS